MAAVTGPLRFVRPEFAAKRRSWQFWLYTRCLDPYLRCVLFSIHSFLVSSLQSSGSGTNVCGKESPWTSGGQICRATENAASFSVVPSCPLFSLPKQTEHLTLLDFSAGQVLEPRAIRGHQLTWVCWPLPSRTSLCAIHCAIGRTRWVGFLFLNLSLIHFWNWGSVVGFDWLVFLGIFRCLNIWVVCGL